MALSKLETYANQNTIGLKYGNRLVVVIRFVVNEPVLHACIITTVVSVILQHDLAHFFSDLFLLSLSPLSCILSYHISFLGNFI